MSLIKVIHVRVSADDLWFEVVKAVADCFEIELSWFFCGRLTIERQ